MPRLKKAKSMFKIAPEKRNTARQKRKKYLKHKYPGRNFD